jgi:hypothetical protein
MSRVDSVGGAGSRGTSEAIDEAQRNTEEFKKMMGGEESGEQGMAYYLKLQRAMMEEQQAFTALSNVMKARSEACLSAARNIRG